MKKYQLWNKTDQIYTPSGKEFTPEQWLDMYSWAKNPAARMVISGGLLNGAFCADLSQLKDRCERDGATFSDDLTDEELLDAIENYENEKAKEVVISPEERIAASLEAQVMMATPDADVQATPMMARAMSPSADDADALSVAAKRIQRSYQAGLWSAALVAMAVQKGIITAAEQQAILQG